MNPLTTIFLIPLLMGTPAPDGGGKVAATRPAVSMPTTTTAPAPTFAPAPIAAPGVLFSPIGNMTGYASNAVNVPVFRKSSVVTHGQTQFTAFYDGQGRVVLAKRALDSNSWETKVTSLTGTLRDAHNAINIGIDGDGYLHIAWNHHNSTLNYQRSKSPLSLDVEPAVMTGDAEKNVTYPEFHLLPSGELIFLYRDGGSGRGNLAMKKYDPKTGQWTHLFSKLIDGENHRNAYWQACTGPDGTIHLSWVWRESPDVASNHDLCYAKSTDGGKTWTKSTGEAYVLPITAATAEYVAKIPQSHELINQTSMTVDGKGHPYIATYFRPEGTDVPQYHVIYSDGTAWHTSQASQLKTPFRLGGGGSKRLPLSRPQILSNEVDGKQKGYLVFRAAERGDVATLATCDDLSAGVWTYRDLTANSLGEWEPSYDEVLWQRDHRLDLFLQHVEQVDGEGVGTLAPTPVMIGEVVLK